MLISAPRSLLLATALALGAAGCAPEGGAPGSGADGVGVGGSGAGTGKADASAGTPTNGSGTGGTFTFNGGGGPGSREMDASCGAVSQAPEEIVVYRDATVTDTIVTYEPVALYIMQDRSSSMVGVLGDPNSWPNASAAITSFVNDPSSQGLEVGLGVFPPISNNPGACNGSDCGQPIVPIAPLPQNAAALVAGMQQANPGNPNTPILLTPTECALNGMIDHCAQHMAATGVQCVAILVTDGAPTSCQLDPQMLANIVQNGFNQGVLTFTLGLPGSNIAFLNQLAQAGGTDCDPGPNFACDLTTGQSSTFLDALNAIRDSVTTTETSQVVTQQVISTSLDCQWRIPAPPDGQNLDPAKVNLRFTPPSGSAQTFGFVASEAECGAAQGNAWYFDDEQTPTEVFVCPDTCDFITSSMGARIDILLGCERREAIPE